MPTELYTYFGSDISTEVKSQFGDSGNVQITDTHILRWINNGQRAIAGSSPFLQKSIQTNLLAGQAAYDLTALFPNARIQSFASLMVGNRKVDVITWQEFTDRINRLQGTNTTGVQGDVLYAAEYGGVLTMWPAPATTVVNGLTVYYMQWPADLALISDKLTVPDRFRNALVSYVLAKAYELGEDFEASATQLELHNGGITQELQRNSLNPTDFYPTISVDEEAW